MCVIMCSETTKPNEDQLMAGHKTNPYGAGVAWIEKDKKGERWLRWRKGIEKPEDVVKLVAKLKPPIVVHFRVPTEGLEDLHLNHPFPVDDEASIAFEGRTKAPLLFHNGTWGDWRRFTLDTALKSGRPLPDGLLNDSRMLAWNANIFTPAGFLQLINEKVILFGLDGLQMFGIRQRHEDGWDFEDGIWFSNSRWKKEMPSKITHIPAQRAADLGGGRPQGTFRANREHTSICETSERGTKPVVEQQVEGSKAQLHERPEEVRKPVGTRECRVPLMASPTIRRGYERIHGEPLPPMTLRDIRAWRGSPQGWDIPPPDANNGMGTAAIEKGWVM